MPESPQHPDRPILDLCLTALNSASGLYDEIKKDYANMQFSAIVDDPEGFAATKAAMDMRVQITELHLQIATANATLLAATNSAKADMHLERIVTLLEQIKRNQARGLPGFGGLTSR